MKYRKRPVVVDAEPFFPTDARWPSGVEQYVRSATETIDGERCEWFGWRIKTLEGWMEVRPGDWIITGVAGELYPCKPEIFDATYEPLPDSKEPHDG